VAGAMKIAASMDTDRNLVINVSGRGDKDVVEVMRLLGEH
jgi:tryptophan synthase beta chain